MNIGHITQPNTKGQIVIPYKMRKSLGIDKDTPLQLFQVGEAVMVRPLHSMKTNLQTKEAKLEVLRKTAGSWAGDDWPETEKKMHVVEIAASKKRKTSW